MKLGLIVVLAAWFVLPSRFCQANPVPDRVFQDFRALVLQTATTGTCSNTSRLIGYFGDYGIDLLSDSDLDEIDRAFAVFAPLLVEAQRPCEELNYKLQEFYRVRATAEQRVAMTTALREWLTARLDSVPWTHTVWPTSAFRPEIQRSRCVAAEMLVAWGDTEAALLIDRVAAPDTMAAEFQWFLKRSVECPTNPSARSLLHVDEDGSIALLEVRIRSSERTCDDGTTEPATWSIRSRRRTSRCCSTTWVQVGSGIVGREVQALHGYGWSSMTESLQM